MARPLEGILVVSVEQALAAPLCSCRLADAGARVIKIERPEGEFYGAIVEALIARNETGTGALIRVSLPAAPAVLENDRVPELGDHTTAVRAEFAR